ncbi:MAG TPA: hypothetical protein VGX23_19650 [Actinocrinis sp.]|nr:hypothetical protein [Actinocrinis sp.]
MPHKAFPTDAHTPVDAAEADRIARAYLYPPAARARGAEVIVTEYEDCFTVLVIKKVYFDPANPIPPSLDPVDFGSGVNVIDKQTGAISQWSSLSDDRIAQMYSEHLAAGQIEFVTERPS